MSRRHSAAVIGGGSWGTAILKILSEGASAASLRWWMRNPKQIQHILKYGSNPNYLNSVKLNLTKQQLSGNLKTVIADADVLIFCIPSAFLKQTLNDAGLSAAHLREKIIVSAIKGFVPENNQIIGEFFNEQYGVPFEKLAVVTGPCHAEEVALEKLSYLTIASQRKSLARELARLFSTRYIQLTLSDDIYGTEYAAVLKNIFAIASGICHGLGYGDNFQAVLISNAIREIKRFVDVVHPISRDINESAYLGDLLVTAYSQFSRNRSFGNMVGKGYSVKSAQMEMNMIAEGYYAVKCLHEINRQHQVEMPISAAVHAILYEGQPPSGVISALSGRLK